MTAQQRRGLIRRLAAVCLASLALMPGGALAQQSPSPPPSSDVQFDPRMLAGPQRPSTDLSRFARSGVVQPGNYDVDISVNGRRIARSSLSFVASAPDASAAPCFDVAQIQQLGIDPRALAPAAATALRDGGTVCLHLNDIIDSGSYVYDSGSFRLDITIPQIALVHVPRDYVDPTEWDRGVTSGTLEYNLNLWNTSGSRSGNDSSATLDLRGGINLGTWHFRQASTLNWSSGRGFDYQGISTYLQHDIPALSGQLTIGDSFTDGLVFDSVGLRGVQLATDPRMWPESRVGFAPVVRGMARSEARVEIFQDNRRIYQTSVTAGAFEIGDLYATGYGGDLTVVVTETDGSQQKFVVPFASVPQLLRPGMLQFSLAAGQLRDLSVRDEPLFAQATIQHGFSNALTAYGGVLGAENYAALSAGVALNTSLGALSGDITQSFANIRNSHLSGRRARASYRAFVAPTRTNLTLSAARSFSSGYSSFRETAIAASPRFGDSFDLADLRRERGRYQLLVNQAAPSGWGNLYLSASRIDYWNSPIVDERYELGYNNQLRLSPRFALAYSLSATRQTQTGTGQRNDQVALRVTVPLRGKSPSTISTEIIHDTGTGWSEQALLSGALGEDRQVAYNIALRNQQGDTVGSLGGRYQAPQATFTAMGSIGPGFQQVSGGISGGIVVHPGGVTLANSMSDTITIVSAKGAKGARVPRAPGARLDGSGNAVVASIVPYRINTLDIDPRNTSPDVQLEATSARIAPRANSVSVLRFDTSSGRAALITLRTEDGERVPFGAEALGAAGKQLGIVGQDGLLFASGLDEHGTLLVTWGEAASQRCMLDYQLPPRAKGDTGYPRLDGICRPAPSPAIQKISASAQPRAHRGPLR